MKVSNRSCINILKYILKQTQSHVEENLLHWWPLYHPAVRVCGTVEDLVGCVEYVRGDIYESRGCSVQCGGIGDTLISKADVQYRKRMA